MIEAYISKVLTYLPFKQRKDIGEELRSMIHDACDNDLSDQNIKRVLLDLGDPSELAMAYNDHKYLIGPAYYARYKELLTLVLRIALPIIFVLSMFNEIRIPIILSDSLSGTTLTIINIINATVFALISSASAALSIFAVITLLFLFLERSQSKIDIFKFNVDDLKDVEVKQKEPNYVVEGSLTIVGSIIGLFVLLNPSLIAFVSIQGTTLTLTNTVFNLDVFTKIVPFGIIALCCSFIVGIIKLIQRRETISIYILDILSSFITFGFIFTAINIPHLFNETAINSLIKSMEQYTTISLNVPFLKQVTLGIIILIFIVDIFSKVFKLYKLKK